MRKQTKLVAVLSTAALLAIGASMTSFAAQGWAEEDGTWVYYDRNGDRVTDKWAKSGNNWYYLDSDGEMAIDTLIEDGDKYYYVDVNGVMVTNQWVAIENEDAGNDNEPDEYWYYFQSNGKALKGPDDNSVSLKTVNGKKYAFTSEGKMLYGWVDASDATIINDDDDAWQRGDYYFGDQNDGAMTVGWKLLDITDDNATSGTNGNNWIQTAFNDDEDQSRWFYFKSNGKKQTASSGDTELKQKTINGKKYAFDEYGRMIAEWAIDIDEASSNVANLATNNEGNPGWSSSWMYFNSIEDGARVTTGWFKVVPAEGLNQSKYDDDEDGWYYADNNGHLYAGELKTIKGKKYGFDSKGKMLDGMKFLAVTNNTITGQYNDDDDNFPFDTEDNFNTNAITLADKGYKCYYFGDGSDGAMKTGKVQVEIDGDKFTFNFGKSGSLKGTGKMGVDDKKYYSSGKLMTAGKDEKYQVITPVYGTGNNVAATTDVTGYTKYDDASQFVNSLSGSTVVVLNNAAIIKNTLNATQLSQCGLTSSKLDKDEYGDLNVFLTPDANGSITYQGSKYNLGLDSSKYIVVNSSGTVSKSSAKNKDGNDVYYKLNSGKIVSTYSEN